MVTIKIKDREVELKYTIESWKTLKKVAGITPMNFETKVQEDMADSISALLYYGLSPEERSITIQNELDTFIDFTIMDKISEAVIEGMPKVPDQSNVEEENIPAKK